MEADTILLTIPSLLEAKATGIFFKKDSFISVFQMKCIELNNLVFSKAAALPYLKLMETMVAQRPQISSQNTMCL